MKTIMLLVMMVGVGGRRICRRCYSRWTFRLSGRVSSATLPTIIPMALLVHPTGRAQANWAGRRLH